MNEHLLFPNPVSPATRDEIIEWHRWLHGVHDGGGLTAYEIINLRKDHATVFHENVEEFVRQQVHNLRRSFHPDRHGQAGADLLEMCNQITSLVNEAAQTLATPASRQTYNVAVGLQTFDGRDATMGAHGGINHALLEGAYGRVRRALDRVSANLELELPKIVVVGLESSGKSSTLERLAMRQAFPRGELFTTRMPICMKLRHRTHENIVILRHVRLAQHGMPRETLQELHVEQPSAFESADRAAQAVVQDIVPVGVIARAIQDFVLHQHPNDTGRSILTDEVIEIEIRAPNVPELELVDLPGIVEVPQETRRASLECTRRYLRDPSCLVLCVLSAGPDTLRSNGMLRILEEEASPQNRLWERTILVLTKVDMQHGAGATAHWRARLGGRLTPGADELEDIPVRRIVPLVNRDAGAGAELADLLAALNAERAWMQQWCAGHPHLGFRADDMGIKGLLQHLSHLANLHIQTSWVPANRQRLQGMRENELLERRNLGEAPGRLELLAVLREAQSASVSHLVMGDRRDRRDRGHEGVSYIRWDGCFEWLPKQLDACMDLATPAAQRMDELLGQSSRDNDWACVLLLSHATSKLLQEHLRAGIVDTLKRVVDEAAVNSHALPIKLSRFARLRAALVRRVETSQALADSIIRLRSLIENHPMVSDLAAASLESAGGRTEQRMSITQGQILSLIRRMAMQHCLLPVLQDDRGELFETATVTGDGGDVVLEEDGEHARLREARTNQIASLDDALAVIEDLAGGQA